MTVNKNINKNSNSNKKICKKEHYLIIPSAMEKRFRFFFSPFKDTKQMGKFKLNLNKIRIIFVRCTKNSFIKAQYIYVCDQNIHNIYFNKQKKHVNHIIGRYNKSISKSYVSIEQNCYLNDKKLKNHGRN